MRTLLCSLTIAVAIVSASAFQSNAITVVLADLMGPVESPGEAADSANVVKAGPPEIAFGSANSPPATSVTTSILDNRTGSFIEAFVISLFKPIPGSPGSGVVIPDKDGGLDFMPTTIALFTNGPVSSGAMGLLAWQIERRVAAAV